jgi:hypothetical protein
MALQLATSFECNAVILISATRPDEEGIARRVADDLAVLSASCGDFVFQHYSVKSRAEFFDVLLHLENEVAAGLRPLVHLHTHADRDSGMEIGTTGERVSWDQLVDHLRPINIRTHNNLCLLVTACSGFYLMRPVTVGKATPFFGLIAPQERIRFEETEDAVGPFFRELMQTRSLDAACQKLSTKFRYYHCERVLIFALARYVRQHCWGQGGTQRREDLLTQVLAKGVVNNRASRRRYRKQIKASIRPDQKLLDHYTRGFLIGRTCSVTMAEVLREIRKPSLSR